MVRKKKLRLYVWDGVLTDWTSGVAFALAYSPEQAKKKIIESGLGEHGWDGLKLDGVEFTVYARPFGYFVYGGG